MNYRVDELAVAAGVSVKLIRSYQSKGLLPPPRREGRVAIYGPAHRERLREIQELKAQGHPLRVIARLLEPGRPDAGGPAPENSRERALSLRDVSERTGLPIPMLRSLEAAGLLRARRSSNEERYSEADVTAARLIVAMADGVPIDELVRVARIQLGTADEVAAECVRLFMSYVRGPIRANASSEKQAAERVVAALRMMLHGSTTLLAYNFQRMVLNAAYDEVSRNGTRSEQVALRHEIVRRLELPFPS